MPVPDTIFISLCLSLSCLYPLCQFLVFHVPESEEAEALAELSLELMEMLNLGLFYRLGSTSRPNSTPFRAGLGNQKYYSRGTDTQMTARLVYYKLTFEPSAQVSQKWGLLLDSEEVTYRLLCLNS